MSRHDRWLCGAAVSLCGLCVVVPGAGAEDEWAQQLREWQYQQEQAQKARDDMQAFYDYHQGIIDRINDAWNQRYNLGPYANLGEYAAFGEAAVREPEVVLNPHVDQEMGQQAQGLGRRAELSQQIENPFVGPPETTPLRWERWNSAGGLRSPQMIQNPFVRSPPTESQRPPK
jgi:hypothetical protein